MGSKPSCYATDDPDMVIDNMSIAAADVPYVTAGPNAQYEAQADITESEPGVRENTKPTEKRTECTSELAGGSERS